MVLIVILTPKLTVVKVLWDKVYNSIYDEERVNVPVSNAAPRLVV